MNNRRLFLVLVLLGVAGSLPALDMGTVINGGLNDPRDVVCVGADYFITTGDHQVMKYGNTASPLTTWAGNPGQFGNTNGLGILARFNNPRGIVAARGGLVVADYGNHQLRFITNTTYRAEAVAIVSTLANTDMSEANAGFNPSPTNMAAAKFRYPAGLAVDAQTGDIYIADSKNNAIRKLGADNMVYTFATNNLNEPMALALDSQGGRIFVANAGNNTISMASIAGTNNPGREVYVLAGSGYDGYADHLFAKDALFSSPIGLRWADRALSLYVSDSRNHVIRRLFVNELLTWYYQNYDSDQLDNFPNREIWSVETYAGRGGTPGFTNGSLTAARMNQPAGLGTNENGDMLIVDSANGSLRLIAAAAAVASKVQCKKPVFGWVEQVVTPDGEISYMLRPITARETFNRVDGNGYGFAVISDREGGGRGDMEARYVYGDKWDPVFETPQIPIISDRVIRFTDGQALQPAKTLIAERNIRPMTRIKAQAFASDKIPSDPLDIEIEFKSPDPIIDAPNPVEIRITCPSVGGSEPSLFYAIDDERLLPEEMPEVNNTNVFQVLGGGGKIPEIIYPSNKFQLWARSYRTNFYASDLVKKEIDRVDYLADRISLGFQFTNATPVVTASAFACAPGQTYYAPITLLKQVPTSDIYGLQFNVGVGLIPAQVIVAGDRGTMASSADGFNWTPRRTGVANQLNAIGWDGATFVAVGEQGAICSSTNRIDWTTRNSPTTNELHAIAASGNLFTAVGARGVIQTSSDGATWVARTSGITSDLEAVVWNGSRFLAVGGQGTVLTSATGANWSQPTNLVTDLYDVAWDGRQFIAVGKDAILASTDGANWIPGFVGASRFSTNDFPTPEQLVDKLMNTTNAVSQFVWTNLSPRTQLALMDAYTPAFERRTNLVEGLNKLLGGSSLYDSNRFAEIQLSDETLRLLTNHVQGESLVRLNRLLLTDAFTTSVAELESSLTNSLYGVAFARNRYVAVGERGRILISTDGWTWTFVANSPATNTLYDVKGNEQFFTAVGANGSLITSSDGIAWSLPPNPFAKTTNSLRAVLAIDNLAYPPSVQPSGFQFDTSLFRERSGGDYVPIPPSFVVLSLPGPTNLFLANTGENLCAVGWLAQKDNPIDIYDATKQSLISFSFVHTTQWGLRLTNRIAAGALSFVVPKVNEGDAFRIRIGRPSASDGFADVWIDNPTNRVVGNEMLTTLTNITVKTLPYIVGDASNFRWYNAGDFGDGNLLNNDLIEVLRCLPPSVNTGIPMALPSDSDLFDAMDSSDARPDLLASDGNDTVIDDITQGDGQLDVTDIYVTYRRALFPHLKWYARYWTNTLGVCMRTNVEVPNLFRGSRWALPAESDTPSQPSLPAEALAIQTSTEPPFVYFVAGDTLAGPGRTIQVPVQARIRGKYPARVVAMHVDVQPLDGAPPIAQPVAFVSAPALGDPAMTHSFRSSHYSAAWLNPHAVGVWGTNFLGTLLVTLPPNVSSNSAYRINLAHVSSSPNGLALLPQMTRAGLVTFRDRSGSSVGDAIPDVWRLRQFGTVTNPVFNAAGGEVDQALPLWMALDAQSVNPVNIVLQLRSYWMPADNGQPDRMVLRWPSVLNKLYVVEYSLALVGNDWMPLSDAIVFGTGGEMEVIDRNPDTRARFYRVRILE